MINKYPYTNFHELNLDWVIDEVKNIKDKTDEIDEAVTTTNQNAEQTASDLENIQNIYEDVQTLENNAQQYADSAEDYYNRTLVLTGSPLTANTANAMTDVNKIYVYTGNETGYNNGHWYYYNGTAWVDGGVYNAVAVNVDETLTVHGVAGEAWTIGKYFDFLINSGNVTSVNNFELNIQANSYWNDQGTTAERTTLSGVYKSVDPLDVTAGDILYIYIYNIGSSARQHAIVFTDDDLTIIERIGRAGGGVDIFDGIVKVPYGATKMLLTAWGSTPTIIAGHAKINYNNDGQLAGKTLSLLGDSISANVTDIPTGNTAYYTNSNAGVTNANQMWYNVANNVTGMTNNVINGWSGSLVTSGVRSASIVPASDPSRCQNLSNGVNNPDIILIAMGVNDYSYNAPLGSWNGIDALNDVTTDFEHAYAVMLERIKETYPNALILCMTPIYTKRGTDTGPTYKNALGLTMYDYAKSIEKIAGYMQCQVIDVSRIGFNKTNYNPTYSNDGTHPNANGQRVIGENVAKLLINSANKIL